MNLEKLSPAALAGAPGSDTNATRRGNSTTPRPPRKWARVLSGFLSGRSFNRFQAERELADHCLHTTVSQLEARGVKINRVDEVVPGFQGTPTHCKRYHLAVDSRQRAMDLLGVAP